MGSDTPEPVDQTDSEPPSLGGSSERFDLVGALSASVPAKSDRLGSRDEALEALRRMIDEMESHARSQRAKYGHQRRRARLAAAAAAAAVDPDPEPDLFRVSAVSPALDSKAARALGAERAASDESDQPSERAS